MTSPPFSLFYCRSGPRVLIATLLLALPVAAEDEWEGAWATNYGEIRFVQDGLRVYGDYHNKGYLEGRVAANQAGLLRGTYQRNDGKWGFFQFNLAPDGQSFSGGWTYADEWESTNFPTARSKGWTGKKSAEASGILSQATGKQHYWAEVFEKNLPEATTRWIQSNETADESDEATPPAVDEGESEESSNEANPGHYSTAEKLASALFAPYEKDGKPLIPALFSPEAAPDAASGYLHESLWESVKTLLDLQKEDPGISLGFDPLVDGQDFEITELVIQPAEVSTTPSGRRPGRVVVTFKNFGEPRELWLGVEDIGGPRPWRLTAVRMEKGHEGRKYDLNKLIDEIAHSTPDEAPSPESETGGQPEPSDPLFIQNSKKGDYISYVSPALDSGISRITATSYSPSEPVNALELSLNFPQSSPIRPGLSVGGVNGRGDWLRDSFANNFEAPIKSSEPTEINLHGHIFPGVLHIVTLADGNTLHFELTPALPAGGLARVTHHSADQQQVVLEAIAHSPTKDAPIQKALLIKQDGDPVVSYATEVLPYQAWLSVAQFLDNWIAAGQPEREHPFTEHFEHLLAQGLNGENTAASGTMAASGARERITKTNEKISSYKLLTSDGDHARGYMVGLQLALDSGKLVPVTFSLRTKGPQDGSKGFRIWDIFHDENGPGIREQIAQ